MAAPSDVSTNAPLGESIDKLLHELEGRAAGVSFIVSLHSDGVSFHNVLSWCGKMENRDQPKPSVGSIGILDGKWLP